MARLAFLGLGAMGAPMAERLVAAGHEVTVWNRTLSKAEGFRGRARIATSPADAAGTAEVVITMVENPEALDAILFGEGGVVAGMQAGATIIDMSTVGADHILDVASRLSEGTELVDAPVLGGVKDAVEGTLQVFVGGTEVAFGRCEQLLAPLGSVMHLGPTGAGAAMKLVANLTLAGLMCLVGEALELADGFGLEQDLVIARLVESPIGPALSRKLDKIESGRYPPGFRLSLLNKDIGLMLRAAERRAVDLPVLQAARGWVTQAESNGLGDLDYSSVIAHIRGRTVTG